LDGKFVGFGEVHLGNDVLDRIDISLDKDHTYYTPSVKIVDCGQIKPISLKGLRKAKETS